MTMASGGNGPTNITVMVARQAATQMGVAAGATSTEPSGQASSKAGSDKETKEANKKQQLGIGKLIKSTLGVQFGIAAMLKQSQIFTGFLGSVFQLIGALVDVILAPLAPYLFKGMEIMAKWIPVIATFSQSIVDGIKGLLDKAAEWSTSLTGIKTSATQLVKSGIEVISIGGLSSLIANNVAGRFHNMTWGAFVQKLTPDSGILKAIKDSFSKVKSKLIKAINLFVKAFSGGAVGKITKLMSKLFKFGGPLLAILGIGFEISDIVKSFKEGKAGEAIVKIGLLVLGIGLPLVLAAVFSGGIIVGIIGALIAGAIALIWEFMVPDSFKQKVYKLIEDVMSGLKGIFTGVINWFKSVFKEITDIFKGIFSFDGSDSIFQKLFMIIMGPWTMMNAIISTFLSEGVKRTINDGFRGFLDSVVNGLIKMVNGLIEGVASALPTIMGFDLGSKIRGIKISEIDTSSINLMMGTDSAATASWDTYDQSSFNYGGIGS